MKEQYHFVQVMIEDKVEVMKLYHSMIGSLGCTWSLEYPSEDTFIMDVNAHNLFCYKNKNGEIIAVVSIDQDKIVDEIPCWTRQLGRMGELSRLAVRDDYQNLGIAPRLVCEVMQVLKNRGYQTVHYLVSKSHKKALASYKKLDFTLVGESNVLDHDWYCYEKKL